jgi:hypothetical protein
MNSSNVIPLRRKIQPRPVPSFDQLTARLVLAKHKNGDLHTGIVAALLLGVGFDL